MTGPWSPTATTRLAGIIGDPVRHSLSPILHNAAYRAMGLDWTYAAFAVAPGQAAAAIHAIRVLGLAGISVTMPHKAAVIPHLDRLSPAAARLTSVNTIARHGDALLGDTTDGVGLLDALREECGWDPDRARCALLGTGGAARAVADALGRAGAAEVIVVGRRPEQAASCAALAGVAGRVGRVDDIGAADVVIDATPAGMAGQPNLPFALDEHLIAGGQLVVDLVYHPRRTPLLELAERCGARTANGLGMLVHQAARQIALWTGQPAPIAAMREAVEAYERQEDRA